MLPPVLPIGRGSSTWAGNSPRPPLQVAEHAADVRMLDAAREEPARLHHLMAGVVDGRGGVIDRADQRELVGVPGHLREDLGDRMPGTLVADRLERPAHLGGGVRLRVPGIDLARPADEKQHDAIDVFILDGAASLRAEEPRQREARAARARRHGENRGGTSRRRM